MSWRPLENLRDSNRCKKEVPKREDLCGFTQCRLRSFVKALSQFLNQREAEGLETILTSKHPN